MHFVQLVHKSKKLRFFERFTPFKLAQFLEMFIMHVYSHIWGNFKAIQDHSCIHNDLHAVTYSGTCGIKTKLVLLTDNLHSCNAKHSFALRTHKFLQHTALTIFSLNNLLFYGYILMLTSLTCQYTMLCVSQGMNLICCSECKNS